MNFEKTNNGTTLTVELIGEVDSMNTPELEEKLLKEIDGVKELIFDLKGLEYISSAGLRVLLTMQKMMKTQGSMVIKNTNDEVMDIFGLKPVQNNLVDKLSGGQKKRLSISIEFISNPSLFILDEPDSGLDGVMARELFVQLRKIADTGKIVIVITHTPDRVIDLFDDVIVLAKDSARTGRLAWYGSIEDARVFFGREKMEEIVKAVNREEEGGDGLADEFIIKYGEVQHA